MDERGIGWLVCKVLERGVGGVIKGVVDGRQKGKIGGNFEVRVG